MQILKFEFNRIDIEKLEKLDQSITNNYDLETEFSFCHIVCTLKVNTNIFSPVCQSWALWISLSSAPAPADSVWSLLLVQLLATAGGRSLDKWLMDPTSKDFFFLSFTPSCVNCSLFSLEKLHKVCVSDSTPNLKNRFVCQSQPAPSASRVSPFIHLVLDTNYWTWNSAGGDVNVPFPVCCAWEVMVWKCPCRGTKGEHVWWD